MKPDFPGTVPTGDLKLTVPQNGLLLLAPAVAPMSSGDQTKVLPEGGSGFEFLPLQAGEHQVTALVNSPGREKANAKETLTIKVVPRTDRKYALLDYLAGIWSVRWGENVQAMLLTEPKPLNLTGTLEGSGSTLQVYGHHDGGSVWLFFFDENLPDKRESLEGKVFLESGFVKVTGTITSQVSVNSKRVDQKTPKVELQANTPAGPRWQRESQAR